MSTNRDNAITALNEAIRQGAGLEETAHIATVAQAYATLALVEAVERVAVAMERLAPQTVKGLEFKPIMDRPLQEDCPTCGVSLPNHDPKCPYATEGR